ncbi:MAG: hypothetical protein K2M20_13725, partial [Lachnospiraceae bacterium]|nr:hypothetical protein [Lachnospiraceae bacterium]
DNGKRTHGNASVLKNICKKYFNIDLCVAQASKCDFEAFMCVGRYKADWGRAVAERVNREGRI